MSGNFVDSNIFLYAFMADDEEKSEKAFSVIKSDSVVLSTQAVNEICVNLLKKSDYQEDDIVQLVGNIYRKYLVAIIGIIYMLLNSMQSEGDRNQGGIYGRIAGTS